MEKEASLPSGGIARQAGLDCLCKSRPTWRVSPHQKSAGGGRSGRVGKTPQARTGTKVSFSRRMSPKMTEFLFLPPSPHWIAFGNHLWIAAWGLRRTECCETAFPGPFFFRHAGAGSAQQIVPPGKGRQIQAQAAARRRDNSCTSVCRYAGLRPAVRECAGSHAVARGYAGSCAVVRRPVSIPLFADMPGFCTVAPKRAEPPPCHPEEAEPTKDLFPVPLTGGGRKKILRCAQDDMGKVQDNRGRSPG